MATLGLAGAGILVLSKWYSVAAEVTPVAGLLPLLWAVGVPPFVGTTSESGLSF